MRRAAHLGSSAVAALLAAATLASVADGAGARCQADGEYGPDSEWSLTVKKRTHISCTGAKAVIASCARRSTPPKGWKVVWATSGPTFSKRDGSRKFTTMAAGGSPTCVSALR